MRSLNFNENIKAMNLNSLYFTKENIIIFSSLVLFTAITMVLISFCFDTLINSFSQWDEECCLLKEENICAIAPKVTPCLSMKQDLSNNEVFMFNSFIDLFNKSHSKYRHFPSYFQIFTNHTSNVLTNKVITLSCIDETGVDLQNLVIAKEVISYNQYLILEQHNNHLNAILNDLCKILLEYRQSNSI